MASTPHASLSTTQGSSSTGFFPIRASVTPDDDDDDDFESNGHDKTDNSETSSGSYSGSESGDYVSGEEFESASEKLFVADPDEENYKESSFFDKVNIFRPSVQNPDEESEENTVIDEESGVTDEHGPFVDSGSPNLMRVMPVAQLSMDDDEFDVLLCSERIADGTFEDNSFSGIANVSTIGVLQRNDSVPRVKVSDAEEDNKEVGLLARGDSSVVNNHQLLRLTDDEDFVDKEYECVVPEGRVKFSVASNLLEGNLKLDDDPKKFVEEMLLLQKFQQDKIGLDGGDGGSSMGTKNQKIVVEPRELKVEAVGLETREISDFKNSDERSAIDGRVALEKVCGPKLEDRARQETSKMCKSPAPEDSIQIVSVDNAAEIDEIHNLDLLGNSDVSGMFVSDRLESQSDANSFGMVEGKNIDSIEMGAQKGFLSNEDIEDLIFGDSGIDKLIMNESKKSLSTFSHQAVDNFHDDLQKISEQNIPEVAEGLETDKKSEATKLFNPDALAALLNAAARAELLKAAAASDGSRVLSVNHPAGSGSSFDAATHASQSDVVGDVVNDNLSEEEKRTFEKIQHMRVKFLRLVHRIAVSPEDSIVSQVLHRLVLAAGIHVRHKFSDESARRKAMQLEAEGKDDLDFCLNILVIGKTGVGKSATINSIFGEKKVMINAFEPATDKVKEIVGTIDGVRIRILDTPGLRISVKEESTNMRILASIKKSTKKFPPDVVLYVDRLDTHEGDLNDLSLFALISNTLSASFWQNAIITLTHAAAHPPEGASGSPLSFEMFVARRSYVIQKAISQAVGDLRLMHLSMMHPVSLAENHPLCLKNERGESVLLNGHIWRSQLLLLCYSLKILSEASSKPKIKLRAHFNELYLPNLVATLLQSRPHPNSTADLDDIDADMELLSDSDEDDYDQLPPFKPLKKFQIDKLSKEQRKAYFEEYDYRVKLLQKKQWREEVKRLKELKQKGKDGTNDHGYAEEDIDQEDGGPATMPATMPDIFLPPSFDSDDPSYRYRMLKPTSQLIAKPIPESQGWDHDVGYDGVGLERNFFVAGQFPGAFAVKIAKDKKEFSISLDSSICAKHGENGSTVAEFDIQTIGRQLAYILRSETKFKNFKLNKTAAGISITLLGRNVAAGLKIEDQIAIGKSLALFGSAGAVSSGDDAAFGANFEVRLRNGDFPSEQQDQSTLGLSLLKWRGDLGLMANLQSQFSIGQNSKMAIQVGMSNKQNGKIIVKTNSSELQIALISIVPVVISFFKNLCFGSDVRNSNKILDH